MKGSDERIVETCLRAGAALPALSLATAAVCARRWRRRVAVAERSSASCSTCASPRPARSPSGSSSAACARADRRRSHDALVRRARSRVAQGADGARRRHARRRRCSCSRRSRSIAACTSCIAASTGSSRTAAIAHRFAGPGAALARLQPLGAPWENALAAALTGVPARRAARLRARSSSATAPRCRCAICRSCRGSSRRALRSHPKS